MRFKLFALIILFAASVFSQNVNYGNDEENNIIIKLVTIGPGTELTSWWGHTAIIVEDRNTGKSKFYNYGLFSFEDDNFVINFVMGRLIFWVGAWKTPNALAYYRGLDRDIRFQILNLSPQKSMEIKRFLENNVLPENAKYLYDHYYDNCSTRIRDIIDNTANGKLKELSDTRSRMTLREHTRRHTYHNPVMDFILMFLMNDTIDKNIKVWDDMFLPSEMENVIDNLQYYSETGKSIKMVKENITYYKSKTVPAVPETAPKHWPFILIIGVFLGFVSIWFVYMHKENLFYIYSMIVGLVIGFLGTLLFLVATLTDHTVAFYNENLFLANPITLLIFVTSILVLKNKNKYFKIFFLNWIVVFCLVLLGLFLKIFPAFDQNNIQAIMLFAPILIGSSLSANMLKNKK